MPVYEWKRWKSIAHDDPNVEGEFEFAITDSPDEPPPGGAWQRVYSFGIMSVPGAGGSPSRKVNTRGSG